MLDLELRPNASATRSFFDRAADVLELDAATRERFSVPEREVTVRMPVRMDDGTVRVFTGFRVRHNTALGPAKGGLRYGRGVTLAELRGLAFAMSAKTALLQLPFGGAKGGIIVDPRALSAGELERLTRAYVRALRFDIGPELDIPGPDMGTSGQVMAWMQDEYAALTGRTQPNVVTGKPIELGGITMRAGATGEGVAQVVALAAAQLELPLRGATIAVQGFGNVGASAARALRGMGARIVAIADIGGAIVRADGLSLRDVENHMRSTGSVAGTAGTETLTPADLLTLPVDVLVLAALGDQVTSANAEAVRARILAEGANGPTDPAADALLRKRGVFVLPDILTNAAGVAASFLEWSGAFRSEDAGREHVRDLMRDAFERTRAQAQQLDGDMRLAAHVLALRRLAAAMKARGLEAA